MTDQPEIFKKRTRIIRKVKTWEGVAKRTHGQNEPEFNQAEKIIARLGGPYPAAALLGIHVATIYRWMDARWGNGLIPTKPATEIRRIARREGILLTKDDWMPELRNITVEEDEE